MKFFPELAQARFTSKPVGNAVRRDRVRRGADVCLRPAGKHLVIDAAQIRMSKRSLARSCASRPNAHRPDMSETQPLPVLKFGVRNIPKTDRTLMVIGQLAQPGARVYFV